MKTLKDIYENMQGVRRSYWSEHNYDGDLILRNSSLLKSWKEFEDEDWATVDSDWEENLYCGYFMDYDEDFDSFVLIVYIIRPKKGKFTPLAIYGLKDSDTPKIVKFIEDVRVKINEHWTLPKSKSSLPSQ